MDLGLILLVSPVLGPLMLGISALIKVVSPGPVFFRQERVGLGGDRFICLKFRSMKPDVSTEDHDNHLTNLIGSAKPMTKLDKIGDLRLIPFGRFLRASALDELAQIINVIRGDMSLVGPRPCTLHEFKQYQPRHLERFSVLPGMTGLWQVSGKNELSFEQMIDLDIDYARRNPIWRDLWIIAKTPFVLVGQLMDVTGTRKGLEDSKKTSTLATTT